MISIGLSLSQAGEENESDLYFKQALGRARLSLEPGQEALAYANIGRRLNMAKKYDATIRFLNLAFERPTPKSDRVSADLFRLLAVAYRAKGNKDEALAQYKRALAIYERLLPTVPSVRLSLLSVQRAIEVLEKK